MEQGNFSFQYDVYDDISQLSEQDALLLTTARKVTEKAYAPYSRFYVGASALLENGEMVSATNQENASYPVGICAERVLLATISSLYPGTSIQAIAVSYNSKEVKNDHPISPCGMCRQALLETELVLEKPIRLILGGQVGKIYVISTVRSLLPLAFTGDELA